MKHFNSFVFLLFTPLFFQTSTTSQDFISIDCKVGVSHETFTPAPSRKADYDNFKVTSTCDLVYLKTQIFSRWGHVVFSETNKNDGFNGYYKKKALTNGVYIYAVDYQIHSGGDILQLKGMLNIAR